MKLRVFRVQPHSFKAMVSASRGTDNRSAFIRETLSQACDDAQAPTQFPVRATKADLRAFSVFMTDDEHEQLVEASAKKGVSKNLFIEAVFDRFAAQTLALAA